MSVKCSVCGKELDSEVGVKIHVSKVHGRTIANKEDYLENKMFSFVLNQDEKIIWREFAKKHNMPLGTLIKKIVRKEIFGGETVSDLLIQLENARNEIEMLKAQNKDLLLQQSPYAMVK